jgi:hypothetical protein
VFDEQVVSEICNHAWHLDDRGQKDASATFFELARSIRQKAVEKLDRLSLFVLERTDEFANAKNELQIQFLGQNFKVGLWVNLAKNLRCPPSSRNDHDPPPE